jgi:hypothetical protein
MAKEQFLFFDVDFFIIHLFTREYIVWVISSTAPLPHPLHPPPSLPGRTCSDLIYNFVEEKT